VRPCPAAELEDVAEPLGGDQAGAGEAAFEQGIGGDRGAVNSAADEDHLRDLLRDLLRDPFPLVLQPSS
jgi:hypothetical protein